MPAGISAPRCPGNAHPCGGPLLSELRAWGRNLNQLTVLAHQGHIESANLREATEMLGKVYEAVNRLLTEEGQVVTHGDV